MSCLGCCLTVCCLCHFIAVLLIGLWSMIVALFPLLLELYIICKVILAFTFPVIDTSIINDSVIEDQRNWCEDMSKVIFSK